MNDRDCTVAQLIQKLSREMHVSWEFIRNLTVALQSSGISLHESAAPYANRLRRTFLHRNALRADVPVDEEFLEDLRVALGGGTDRSLKGISDFLRLQAASEVARQPMVPGPRDQQ